MMYNTYLARSNPDPLSSSSSSRSSFLALDCPLGAISRAVSPGCRMGLARVGLCPRSSRIRGIWHPMGNLMRGTKSGKRMKMIMDRGLILLGRFTFFTLIFLNFDIPGLLGLTRFGGGGELLGNPPIMRSSTSPFRKSGKRMKMIMDRGLILLGRFTFFTLIFLNWRAGTNTIRLERGQSPTRAKPIRHPGLTGTNEIRRRGRATRLCPRSSRIRGIWHPMGNLMRGTKSGKRMKMIMVLDLALQGAHVWRRAGRGTSDISKLPELRGRAHGHELRRNLRCAGSLLISEVPLPARRQT
jgi:hypothetical protein